MRRYPRCSRGSAKLDTTGRRPAIAWLWPRRSISRSPSVMKPPHSPVDEGAPACRRAHPLDECAIGRQRTGVQLRIAARQIDRVSTEIGRLVRHGREETEFGAGCPPAIQHRRISEGKRWSRATAIRRPRGRSGRAGGPYRPSPNAARAGAAGQINMRGDQRRGALKKVVEFGQFVRLDKSEMPFG